MRPHKLTDLDTTPSVGPSYPTTAKKEKKEKKPSLVKSRKEKKLTWSLTSGPMRLVEVRASWPGHPR